MQDLREVPADELEKIINFNQRHKMGSEPIDYLRQFLEVSRQFGYATGDGTWGELEKELTISFRNLVKYRRALDFIVECVYGDDDEETFDKVLELGEEHWAMKRESKKRIADFLQRLERAA